MKKIFIIFSLFLSLSVAHASDGIIPTDNSFTLNLWFDVASSGLSYKLTPVKPIVIVSSADPIVSGLLILEKDYTSAISGSYAFTIQTSNGAWATYIVYLPDDGRYMFTIKYGAGLNSGTVYPHIKTALLINAVPISLNSSSGVTNEFIGGDVELSDDVVPGSFFYYPEILNNQKIQSLFDFGQPGTINYQVNLLFWEVIKHFRSFF